MAEKASVEPKVKNVPKSVFPHIDTNIEKSVTPVRVEPSYLPPSAPASGVLVRYGAPNPHTGLKQDANPAPFSNPQRQAADPHRTPTPRFGRHAPSQALITIPDKQIKNLGKCV